MDCRNEFLALGLFYLGFLSLYKRVGEMRMTEIVEQNSCLLREEMRFFGGGIAGRH